MYQKIRKLFFRTLVPAVLAAMMIPATAFAEGKSCSVTIPAEIQVTGSSIPADVEYKLVMERVTENAPMPETAEAVRTGAGQVDFGPITYTSPDDYQYRIYQNSEAKNRFTYDDTVYLVTVRVTNSATAEGGLASQIWITNEADESAKADSLLFTNHYSRPSSGGGGGGGGGNPGGGPYVPGGPGVEGDGLTEIVDDGTPLAPGFGDGNGTQINDDPIPLALPKTGDTTNLALWAALMAASGGCLIFLAVTGRRRDA